MAAVFTTAGPSEETWAIYQPLITRLYQAEARPLKEVIRLLGKNHGFRASEKMYKSRIRKWKIDKKRKRPEMLFALKAIESRRRQGKSTDITIRGHTVTEVEVRRYFIRQKTSTTEDAAAYEAAPTPPELEYGTPTVKYAALLSNGDQDCNTTLWESGPEPSEWPSQNKQGSRSRSGPFPMMKAAETTLWPVDITCPELRAVRSKDPFLEPDLNSMQELRQARNIEPELSVALLPSAVYSLDHVSDGLESSRPTTVFSTCEEALSLVAGYHTRYYFTSNNWMRFANDTLFAAHVDAKQSNLEYHEELYAELNDPGHMTSSIEVAVGMFEKGEVEAAGSLLDSACAGIKALVTEEHP